jgi:hypothetical protein
VTAASPDLARQALSHIPASDRDTWVRMAMAIKSEFGEDGRNSGKGGAKARTITTPRMRSRSGSPSSQVVV